MRVAVVFWQLDPTGGGVYTFADDLFDSLRRSEPESKHEFVYYAAAAAKPPPAGVLSIPYAGWERRRRGAIAVMRELQDRASAPRRGPRTWFERSLSEQRVDMVWFATNYAEHCDLPFVFTMFDVEHVRQPWFPEVSAAGEWARRDRYFTRYLARAACVIAPNEAGRGQVVHHFRLNPERVLCLGHPTPAFAREAGRREPLPRARVDRLGLQGPYLLYPAQFWAHKNHGALFDALVELRRDGGEQYELVLVGSDKGQLEHVMRRAREIGVADRVRFLGFVETADLVALYQHAHALTYASFFGPENLPPLEAFAIGCPVVAADVAGAREQLGDAALLVSPLEPESIAEAVRRIESPALRETMIVRGRARADEWTPDHYVRGVLRFFDEFERIRRCWP